MTRDEAAAILRRQSGDLHTWAAAGAYLHSFYSHEGRAELRPFTAVDAVTYDRRPADTDDLDYVDHTDIGYGGRTPPNGASASKPKPAKEPLDLDRLTRQIDRAQRVLDRQAGRTRDTQPRTLTERARERAEQERRQSNAMSSRISGFWR